MYEGILKREVEKYIIEGCKEGKFEIFRTSYLFQEEIIFSVDCKSKEEMLEYKLFEAFCESHVYEEGITYPLLARRGLVPYIDYFEENHVEIVFCGSCLLNYRETVERAHLLFLEAQRDYMRENL